MFILKSETRRVHFNGGYRDFVIHEILDVTLKALKLDCVLFPVMGFAAGFIVGALVTLLTGPYPKPL